MQDLLHQCILENHEYKPDVDTRGKHKNFLSQSLLQNIQLGFFDFEKPFEQVEIQMEKGDSIYMTSDGYPDQFGGENDKKFMIRQFKEMLLEIQEMPMSEQKDYLSFAFKNWKGSEEQADDVCVVGVRI